MRVKQEDLKRFAQTSGISPRELDVISCILDRKISIKDIAKELNLSPSTVNNHLNNIFTKTNTSSKAELMVCLINGLSEKIETIEEYRKTPKVLVIDDEADICTLLKHELEACGFEVYAEVDPVRALDAVSRLELDFIVSDIKMPNLSGYELLSKVRKLHKYKPEILFITGYSEYTKEYAYHLGAIGMFSKPVRSDKIVNALMESFIEETSLKKKYLGDEEPQEGIFPNVIHPETMNLGTGGMFIEVSDLTTLGGEALKEGKRIKLLIGFSNGAKPQPVIAEIKWRRLKSNNGYKAGLGVKFVEMDENSWQNLYEITRQNEILSYIPIGKDASTPLPAI